MPLETLCDAGWINTTANYLWVLCLGSFALRPLKHLCLGERCAPWEWAVCPLCTLYGADMEQMAAILLGSYLACGGYLLFRRQKLFAFYFVQLALIALSVVFALTAPGNALRTAAEIRNSFPGFAELNFGEKLAMGFLKAGQYYFAAGFEQKSFLFPLLSGALFLGVLKKYRAGKGAWRIAVAAAPFAFYWLIGQLGNRLLKQNLVVRCGHIIALIGGNRQIPGAGPYSWGQVSLQLLVYLALTGCVAACIYFLHGKSGETLLELTVLGAGFCSLILMGFTPTVYASGDRTALYCSAAILIVVLRNLLLLLFPEKESGGET